MELFFTTAVNGLQLLIISAKYFMSDVWLGSEYAFRIFICFQGFKQKSHYAAGIKHIITSFVLTSYQSSQKKMEFELVFCHTVPMAKDAMIFEIECMLDRLFTMKAKRWKT